MSRILIVEDESAIAELISLNLRHAGHEVTLAATAEQAQSEVDRVLPDLVVLDWMLPGQSGLTLAQLQGELALEVQRGRVIARTRVMLQGSTKALLGGKLAALGGADTVRTAIATTAKGMPWTGVRHSVSAPAALLKEVDVISWARP